MKRRKGLAEKADYRAARLWAILPPDDDEYFYDVGVYHSDGCDIYQGGVCTCKPSFLVILGHDEPGGKSRLTILKVQQGSGEYDTGM